MKIEWRPLLLVAVVAALFGGGTGYLSGNTDRLTHLAFWQEEAPQSGPAQGLDALEGRLRAVEGEVGGRFGLSGSLESRVSSLESRVRAAEGEVGGRFFGLSGSLESRVSSLESRVSQLQGGIWR